MNAQDRGAERSPVVRPGGTDSVYPHADLFMSNGVIAHPSTGLTKREEFAKAAMQGLIATMADEAARLYVIGNAGRDGCSPKERLVAASVEYADALLEALNQEPRT